MAIPFNLPSEEDTEEYYRRLDQLLADLYDVLRHILFRPRTQQPAHNHQQQQAPVVDAHGDNESEDHEPPDHGGEDPSPDALEQRLHPLPDLVANVGSSSAAPSRPLGRGHPRRHQDDRRRRRDSTTTPDDSRLSPEDQRPPPPRKPRESKKRCSSLRRKAPCCPASLKFSHSLKTSAENWVMVGEELRKIAEDFRSKTTTTTTTSRSDSSQLKHGAPDLPRTKRVELKASSLLSLLVPAPFCGSVWTTVIIIVGWKLLMRHNR
ncbi:hypothetical protein LSTR_LSTR008534 [Laodelphax striatellus]|uniref:Uncharacterized protein n=1 Tax=Laodelphax striatellus TaxID=195883 RepID=A0A482WRX9_LAOST|nr:hypothetical protein LSTR_LSTR008534 [Laodelphax striatellus]